jgi:trehalose-6-phosphatase
MIENNKTYCFDLDGTLCTNTEGDYESALPYTERISIVNDLYEKGNTIIIETARGSKTGIDWNQITKNQLNKWGISYHKLRAGVKIAADIYIDDKGINDKSFFE